MSSAFRFNPFTELFRAARLLRTSMRYATLAIATIALGVGACTAVFSIVDCLRLQERPGIAEPERLVDIGRTQDGSGFDNFSYPDFEDYRAQNTAFIDMAATEFEPRPVGLAVGADAQSANAHRVSSNYFRVLGTPMAMGRDFTISKGAAPEIIISHRYWERRFNSDPRVIGETLLLNGHPVTVIGVTAADFTGATILAPDLWMPMSLIPVLEPGSHLLSGRDNVFTMAIGRLKPGINLARAQSELSAIAQRLEKTYPTSNRGRGVAVRRSSRLPGEINDMATLFMSVLGLLTGLTMMVACTNIAGLTTARGAVRRREFAVRLAIGASRSDLVRQIVAEQIILFSLGGAGGALLCFWLLRLAQSVLPHLPVPLFLDLKMNPAAFAFAGAFALLSGLLSSFGPALQSSRFDLLASLRHDDPADRPGFSLRKIFLALQLTFSLTMLITAASLAWSVLALSRINPKFESARVEFAQFDLSTAGMDTKTGRIFMDDLLRRVRALPGVEEAGYASGIPLENTGRSYGALRLPGAQPEESSTRADWDLVSPGYFDTLGIPILRGRNFDSRDRAGSPLVTIVNQTMAQRLWPGRDPIGQILLNEDNEPMNVIGVARNAKYRTISEEPRPHLYAPFAQMDERRIDLLIRTRAGGSIIPQVRQLVRQLAPALPFNNTQSLDSSIAANLLPHRIAATVACAAGLLALVLAVMGVYGITLYSVSTRRREFGVRHALGATRGNLMFLALRGSLRMAVVAIPLGTLGAFGVGKLIAAVFGDAMRINPWIFGGGGILFFGIIALAAALPARSAARVDPMIALRSE